MFSAARIRQPRRCRLEVEALEDRCLLAMFTVTTLMDNGSDAMPTPNSLRKAIMDANATDALDIINFNIGGGEQTIAVPMNSPLPAILRPVIIDGTPPMARPTQRIVIDGANAGNVNGLIISSVLAGSGSGSTIKGLTIVNFKLSGILIDDTSSNVIGGANAQERNIISNNWNGVSIHGDQAVDNELRNNWIGIDSDGFKKGNSNHGVQVSGGASRNRIGAEAQTDPITGVISVPANIISGNSRHGIAFIEAGRLNKVEGNFIGTTFDGLGTADGLMRSLGNGGQGVAINKTKGTTIGGTTAGRRNIISNNAAAGIDVAFEQSSDNVILGNFIGTDKTGDKTKNLGNKGHGIYFSQGAKNNRVEKSLIGFNEGAGVSEKLQPGEKPKNKVFDPNSIFNNGGLGIDIGDDGMPTDFNRPELTSAVISSDGTLITIVGEVYVVQDDTFDLEFFANFACDMPYPYGEGDQYIGTGVVTTSGGFASFVFMFAFDPYTAVGTVITATATGRHPDGFTSEFSLCFQAENGGNNLNGLSQTSGPTGGATSLIISGRNFREVRAVLFGNAPARFTVLSPTQISVTTPAHAAGTVSVRVITTRGASPVSTAARFTYGSATSTVETPRLDGFTLAALDRFYSTDPRFRRGVYVG